MSSQTPNINLTLPTGAEKVSRQIINENNTKIDTAIGTLNSNMNARTNIPNSQLTTTHTIQDSSALYVNNKIVTLNINMVLTSAVSSWDTLITLPSSLRPITQCWVTAINQTDHTIVGLDVTSGAGAIRTTQAIANGKNIVFSVTYISI